MSQDTLPTELIGQSPAFLDALAHASAAAAIDRPLLILGERGSGKELLAGRIHFLSRRWEGPFVKLNCAALSEDLLESELFGHEAGAFTGAQKRHRGRFERAEGGTLFLDEIASASMRVQEKLLRVIEYGEYERVGGEAAMSADVRVVAAANIDLEAAAAAAKFRPDLLDRLSFDIIAAPPLRERKEDIPILAAHFAARFAQETGAAFDGFEPTALAAFMRHDWPGNVRELKNAAERSFFRWAAKGGTGPVGAAEIDPFVKSRETAPARPRHIAPAQSDHVTVQEGPPTDLRAALDLAERRWTVEALALSGGHQARAADRLGLTYDQLRGIIRKHKIAV